MSVIFHETESAAEGWPTARRYPRSLSDAFPDVRAPAIQRTRARFDVTSAGHRLVAAIAIVGVCAFVVLAFTGALQ